MEQQKIYLFIDEKGDRSPKNKLNEPFILLGVSIKERYINEFYQKMIEFKLKLRPSDDPLSWELKGKRGHFDEGQKVDLNTLRKTWEEFSQFISSLTIPFHTYCVISNKNKIMNSKEYSNLDWSEKRYENSFIRVNFYSLLFSFLILEQRNENIVIQENGITSIENQFPFEVYYDDMNNKVINKQFNAIFNSCLSDLKVLQNCNLQFVKFENDKLECLGIEFVDMIIYVLHRFLIGKDVINLSDNYDSLFKYYSSILHSIRHSFIKNHYFGKIENGFSSCVLLSDYKDYNFAVSLENELFKVSHGKKSWNGLDL